MSGTLHRREYADERSEANEAGADAVKPAPRVLNHSLHMEGFFMVCLGPNLIILFERF